jgi:hypothetical protein
MSNRIKRNPLFFPANTLGGVAHKNHELVNLRQLGLVGTPSGGAKGYNAVGDVLTATADGRDLNDVWAEFQAAIGLQNASRQRMIDLLTFPVTSIIEDVPQFGGGDFEEASEYGVPQGIRPITNVLSLGYPFKWYDLAARFTWQFLAEAPAPQVEAVNQAALEADNRLVFNHVMKALFNDENSLATINGQNYNVYTFWNGDGTIPPPYKTNTFDGTHTHFRSTNAAAIDSQDLEFVIDDLQKHGYGTENGTTMFMLMNTAEVNVVRSFRFGVVNNNAAVARWDFVPATGQPPVIVPNTTGLLGTQVSGSFRGMNVAGSYGPAIIIEEEYIPAGYFVTLASGGDANLNNPLGFREHSNPALRGLRLVKGREPDYPLIDSYYARGFGIGVRQRGAAFITEVAVGATYEPPPMYS